jgi:hypothetical protein
MGMRETAIGVGLILVAANARAQAPVFRAEGVVRAANGSPLAGATVSTDRARVETDSLGTFRLALQRTDSTTITIRRLGFAIVTFTMLTDSLALNDLAIVLEPVVRELDELRVSEQRTVRVPTLERFAERRHEKQGFGFFLTREEILKREGMPLSSLLAEARGVTVIRSGNRAVLRFTRWTQRGRACAPHVWIDGVHARGLEVDDIPSADVEAVELYASAASAPTEFQTGNQFQCGVVGIWTRRPIRDSR